MLTPTQLNNLRLLLDNREKIAARWLKPIEGVVGAARRSSPVLRATQSAAQKATSTVAKPMTFGEKVDSFGRKAKEYGEKGLGYLSDASREADNLAFTASLEEAMSKPKKWEAVKKLKRDMDVDFFKHWGDKAPYGAPPGTEPLSKFYADVAEIVGATGKLRAQDRDKLRQIHAKRKRDKLVHGAMGGAAIGGAMYAAGTGVKKVFNPSEATPPWGKPVENLY